MDGPGYHRSQAGRRCSETVFRTRGKLDAETEEYLDFIIGAGRRMQALIQDLLDFSRVSSPAQRFERVQTEAVLVRALLP
ncbi:MAG: histidine kinase dimerization/phospho-acceptor domain-containing protein [Methanomicrobiales archaeon]|nr:histidine kinase dimerization/phospho-acceptor domain-containing protein [Methanomicrobiales archaeon]